ncbi:DUF2269 family protein [Pseudooceanicola atlanticus]|uniref:Membrane protein n=1 Tax=Pseudooceanicola atlanticus TaxID=1461694 RepID=A0A0A0ECD7_9RHOB|nr:DUF2269 domain-containing protein [Pseudooceanicola atlanticus]KGM47768.1 membrane protein [Pseudooceanicola atlanticus]
MMYHLILYLHVIGAAVLFGTGAGIAFFMVMAQRGKDPKTIAHVAGTVVIADTIFTATAAMAQPITGYVLARMQGWPLAEGWVMWALILYVVVGVFWLPVVWIQIQLRDMARDATLRGAELPDRYHRLYRVWFAFGFPAFAAVMAILWLMITKPAL